MIIIKVNENIDYNAIKKIEDLCFDDAWSEHMIRSEMSNDFSHIYIAKNNDEIIGYIIYRELFEIAEIMRIAVLPEYRKHGLGMGLMKCMTDNLDTSEQILLEVSADNSAAIALYKKIGFEELDIRPGYYKHSDGTFSDAINMRLIL